MSNILEAVAVINERTNVSLGSDYTNNNNKRILKSKENIFRVKCNKQLKKKLKKYKLRRSIDEDPDILDVSQNLINSLNIKSITGDGINTDEEDKPRNYLLKMVRTKKPCKESKKLSDIGEPFVQNQNLKDKVIPSLENNENQGKKEMDAFAVMMNSRNKIIGSNSPGKSNELISLALHEVNEKREMKVKRVLSLEKMAEAKGSLKKKEIEEYRDRFVMQKMLERAEKLKDMITNPDIDKSVSLSQSAVVNSLSQNQTHERNTIEKNKKKTLQLCDLFNEPTSKIQENKTHKKIAQEDIEFLNKLSPSIKKKENMLSYFNKVTKESDTSLDLSDKSPPDKNNKVIKVKFTPKRKKKIKTLKLKSNIEDLNGETEHSVNNKNSNEVVENNERRKRKRTLNNGSSKEETLTPVILENIIDPFQVDIRPKRVTKKPIKYSDDVNLFSSDEDEELHIFTPKKKKNNGKLSVKSNIENKEIENEENVGDLHKRKETLTVRKEKAKSLKLSLKISSENQDNSQTYLKSKRVIKLEKRVNKSSSKKVEPEKKATKLAPIFIFKPQLSPAAIEAKQNFLKSGVPEKLKKHKKSQPSIVTAENILHVVHVQQTSSVCSKNDCNILNLLQYTDIEDNVIANSECSFKTFFTTVPNNALNVPSVKHKPNKLLKSLKNACPKFPVYRTYHLLRGKSKGEFKDCNYPDMDNSIEIIDSLNNISNETPDKLNWCEKYKPTSSKQIIGNFESIKELKRWLETWTERLIKAKSSKNYDSDSSDFYHSDTDTRDALRNTDNLLIISGQTGSGKTSSVYAVAAELAIKVIEVNASRKRTGKIMLQDLQEATQSHKVNRGKSNLEHSQKSQEVIVTVKKRGRPKKVDDVKKSSQLSTENNTQPSQSQENVFTDMSLILIDDADIVFDQDDGFCSALSQLIQSSKRPVILVTSSLTCPHLQKFLPNRKILHMRSFLPRMLGTWLDIMCLADVGFCFSGLGARILDLYKGDIRKTVNCLQFYMNSNKHNQVEDAVYSQIEFNIDDEASSMSWADSESLEDPIFCDKNSQIYIDQQVQVLSMNDKYAFNFWWSLPKYYTKDRNETTTSMNSQTMDDISNILDTLSISDVLDQKDQTGTKYNISNKPWYSYESASVLEIENFSNYNKPHNFLKDIKDELMKITICKVQETMAGQNSLDISSPSMSFERQRERLVWRHNKLSSFLSPLVVLDRKATALDYWSTCRAICRLEKNKTDSTLKRNNRFFHYLKSINFLCKTELFNGLADSLS